MSDTDSMLKSVKVEATLKLPDTRTQGGEEIVYVPSAYISCGYLGAATRVDDVIIAVGEWRGVTSPQYTWP